MPNPFRNTSSFLPLFLEKLYEGECWFPSILEKQGHHEIAHCVQTADAVCLVEDGACLLLLERAELRPSEGTGREAGVVQGRDRLFPRTS